MDSHMVALGEENREASPNDTSLPLSCVASTVTMEEHKGRGSSSSGPP